MTQLTADVQSAANAIGIGSAAIEFLIAEKSAKSTYEEYRAARDAYLRKVDPARRLRVRNVIEDHGFKFATDHLYSAYLSAKRKERNAKRRLDNKFRRISTGGNDE